VRAEDPGLPYRCASFLLTCCVNVFPNVSCEISFRQFSVQRTPSGFQNYQRSASPGLQSLRNLQWSSRLFHKHTGQGRHNEALKIHLVATAPVDTPEALVPLRACVTSPELLLQAPFVRPVLPASCTVAVALQPTCYLDGASCEKQAERCREYSHCGAIKLWLSQYLCEFVWHGCPRVRR